jgi:hypothetical protein
VSGRGGPARGVSTRPITRVLPLLEADISRVGRWYLARPGEHHQADGRVAR